jgi:hypothetical protein
MANFNPLALADLNSLPESDEDIFSQNEDEMESETHGEQVEPTTPIVYKKGPWSLHDALIMLDARQIDWMAHQPGCGPRTAHQTQSVRWTMIAEKCLAKGVSRSPQQCQDKWEAVRSDFQKVWDYENNIPSGKKSYWEMDSGEKKQLKTKAVVLIKIYNFLVSWLPASSRAVDPTEVMDTTSFGGNNTSKFHFSIRKKN